MSDRTISIQRILRATADSSLSAEARAKMLVAFRREIEAIAEMDLQNAMLAGIADLMTNGQITMRYDPINDVAILKAAGADLRN